MSALVRALGPLWSVVFVIELAATLCIATKWHTTALVLIGVGVVVAGLAIWYDKVVRGGGDDAL